MDLREDWFEVAKKVITRPKEFFAKMPTSGGYEGPLVFAVINMFIAGLLGGALSSSVGALSAAIGGAIVGAVGIFIAAGILHTAAVAFSAFTETPAPYYAFFAAIEIACTVFIVWYAWTWVEEKNQRAPAQSTA